MNQMIGYTAVGSARDTRVDSVPEPELQRRYQALRADRIQRARFEARRDLIGSGLSLVIAILLFAFHWRWLRRGPGRPAA